jgi:hypothetical protein
MGITFQIFGNKYFQIIIRFSKIGNTYMVFKLRLYYTNIINNGSSSIKVKAFVINIH